jgi:HAD superfamily hydrolase (TIGR01459 family)
LRIIERLSELADEYDGYVLDLWGVVHDGREPYAGVPECLAELRRRGKRVVFLTNAPRRAWFVQEMLDRMGLGPELHDGIMSSGEVTWLWLKQRTHPFFAALGPRGYHIGPERDLVVVEDAACELVPTPEAADFLLNTGPDPDRGPTSVEPYRAELERCARAGLPMICVNPDRAVMVAGKRILCAGAWPTCIASWAARSARSASRTRPSTGRCASCSASRMRAASWRSATRRTPTSRGPPQPGWTRSGR